MSTLNLKAVWKRRRVSDMRPLTLIILCALLVGCGDKPNPNEIVQTGPPITRSNYASIWTVDHDSHKFIVCDGDCILHHPDCPCMKKGDGK